MDNHLHTVNVYNRHVKEYVGKFMSLDLYKDTFDHLLEILPMNAHVLELGCGPGNVVKYLKAKRPDLHILGIDLAPEMIKEAERQNPGSTFRLMDVRNADQLNRNFDAVIAAFCLPYISYSDADALFRKFSNLIVDKGLLYLSFMEGTAERSGFEKTSFTGSDEMYINYYERAYIEHKLEEQHFNIESFYAKDYPETDGSVTTDLIYIATKC
jgi:trans-aconitate methyltransferase